MKALLTIGAMAFLLLGCSTTRDTSAREMTRAVLGRWQEVGSPATLTFHNDGKVEIMAGQSSVSGKYSFISPTKLRIEVLRQGGDVVQSVYDVAISSEKMRMQDQEGAADEYVRIK